jgi:YidC/Oxa1 family membrane protein insertase
VGLGRLHRRSGDRDPDPADPAVRQADQRPARLQILQPEIKKIQTKYKGKTDPESRQKQQQEMMKLYKDNGTNPLASCLPIILQAPIFFALFHILNGIGKNPPQGKGFMSDDDAQAGCGRIDLRGAHLGQVHRRRLAARPDRLRHPHRADVGDDLHDAEAADEQEHAG